MPRQDRHDDDTMSRDRDYPDVRGDRDYRDYEDRGQRALFRSDRDRSERGRNRESGYRDRSESGEQSYGPDDHKSGIPTDETERLIASNKVEGTPVYDRNGDRLGSIQNFMVDKFRGKVVYAVLKHSSGFLGLDERYYPLEWDQLTFDTRLGGYHIDMTEDQLKQSGSWDRSERWGRMQSDRERFDRDRDSDRRREFSRDRDRDRGSMREVW